LRTASKEQFESICDIARGIYHRKVPLTARQEDNLKRNKKSIYLLVNRTIPWTEKRNQLIRNQRAALQQRGGFPPLLALLAPLIAPLLKAAAVGAAGAAGAAGVNKLINR